VQERIVTVRNGRFVVPVRAGRAGGDRYVLQDRSSSGATFFVEPLQAVTHNNELAQERLAERNEVLRVLRELTALVEGCAEPLSELGGAVARLDLLLAKGRLSIAMRGSEPVITDKDAIVISAGRHPLIAEDPVPIDITLGGVVRALILTGPNAGGKTVALKMVGLFQLMAQAGLHVPALDGTRLPVFGDIFAVIGDEQSIERGLSTFTSHLTDIAEITASAKRGALVLIDEICSGSDPQEGTALACSILKSLMDAGAACMATSHHGGLKTFASVTPGAKNARVLFDEDRGAPRFIVEIGLAGKSHALEVAARAGLPRPIVEGARGYLDAQSQMAERMLAELEQMKGVLAVEKAAIDHEKEKVAVELRIVEEKISAAEKQRRETLAKAVAQADKLVEETRDKCRRLLDRADAATALPEKAAVKGEIERTRREVKEVVQKVRPRHGRAVSQQDLKPGATLTLRDTGQQAQFLSGPDRKGRVKVLIGEITMTTDTKNLGVPDGSEPPQPKKYRTMAQHEYYIEAAKDRARDNIDVRGMRAAEAIETLEPEIATLHLAGRRQFTIVTGVGTGALMRAVHEYLTGNPFVARFEPAPLSQGGIGATIVFLSE